MQLAESERLAPEEKEVHEKRWCTKKCTSAMVKRSISENLIYTQSWLRGRGVRGVTHAATGLLASSDSMPLDGAGAAPKRSIFISTAWDRHLR